MSKQDTKDKSKIANKKKLFSGLLEILKNTELIVIKNPLSIIIEFHNAYEAAINLLVCFSSSSDGIGICSKSFSVTFIFFINCLAPNDLAHNPPPITNGQL